MPLLRYRPAAPLDAHVDCFWWSQRDQSQSYCEHMLPGGSAQLVFALHETQIVASPGSASRLPVVWSRGVLHGPQWNYFVSGPKPAGAVAGVSFRPGAAAAVLGIPMHEVADRHVPLDDLWSHRGRTLHERLLAARTPGNVFRLLERELIARLDRTVLIHPVVARALAARAIAGASLRVAEVQQLAGLSSRHFIALFRAAVGLTPKHYYRVQRFTSVLQDLAGGEADLADLAAQAGYSDQSHLNREFRAFAGITPTQYRPRGPDGVLHHRALESSSLAAATGKKHSRLVL